MRILSLFIIISIVACSSPEKAVDRNELAKKDTTTTLDSNSASQEIITEVKVERNQKFIGIYQYIDKYEDQYQLEIKCINNKLKVIFIAPAPQGEHGMFYSITGLTEIQFGDSTKFSFKSSSRDLYAKQITLESFDSLQESDGGENIDLEFHGTLDGEILTINCITENQYDCYFEQVELTKKTDNKR